MKNESDKVVVANSSSNKHYYDPNMISKMRKQVADAKERRKKLNTPQRKVKEFDPTKLVEDYRFKRSIDDRNSPKKATVGSVVIDALNVPQKAMMYGATAISRGEENARFETPSTIMKEDWGWGKSRGERIAMQGADLILDPISFLAASKLKRGWGNSLKMVAGRSGLPVSSEFRMRLLKQMGSRAIAKADKIADAQGSYEYVNKEFSDKPKPKEIKSVYDILHRNKGSVLLRKNNVSADKLSGK